ncbi:MAG: PIG-L family deacetylase [Deltaproteobacteria bacterium]|nr:PIG-L family deacetylase [Deltaproteobacteria bacterium]MBW2120605.1 PIG-L family deacetylase [Deltaproteobacteria bacterium]
MSDYELDGSESVLVISPHPDDVDFGCSGTIARWSRMGMEVGYVICTSGERGTDDSQMDPERLAAVREEEQLRAAEVVGVRRVSFLRLEDGGLENNQAFREILVRVIRTYRPDILLTMDPANTSFDNPYVSHSDHRATALAVFDAVYPAARNRNFFPEQLEQGLAPHPVDRIYFFGTDRPNTWIDITDTMEAKLEALRCHKSQMGDFENLEARIRERHSRLGAEKGMAYAEVFRYLKISR